MARSTETGLLLSLVLDDPKKCDKESGTIAVEIETRWRDGNAVRLLAVERGNAHLRVDIPDELIVRSAEFPSAINCAVERPTDTRLLSTQLPDRANNLITANIYGSREALDTLIALSQSDRSPDAESSRAVAYLSSDLSRRARRSFHIEPLARLRAISLQDRDPCHSPEFGERLENLFHALRDRSSGVDKSSENLVQLIRFADLQSENEMAICLTRALSAGLGGRHDLSVLVNPPGGKRRRSPIGSRSCASLRANAGRKSLNKRQPHSLRG